MSEQPILLTDISGSICKLTLNRPKQYNALSEEMLNALCLQLDQIAADDHIHVVILAANGKAFCAGHDLKQMRANDSHAYQHKLFTLCSTMMQKIVDLPQPVIAQVQGMATAAGCQLVSTCDLAITAEECQFAVSGIRLGLFCSTPAVGLSRNVSPKRAMEMLMTGDFIDSHTALEYGLVNQVVSTEKLETAVMAMAHKIASRPNDAVRLGKKLFYEQLGQPLNQAYCTATDAISNNMMFDDAKEGIDAFIEKRDPNW